MALLLESLCGRAQKALASGTFNAQVDYDLNMSVTVNQDGSIADVPLGTASLALLTVYDRIGEEDYPVTAWWHRLTSSSISSQKIRGLARKQLHRFPPDR